MRDAHVQLDGIDDNPPSDADRALERARRAVNNGDFDLVAAYATLSIAERLMSVCDVVVHTAEMVEQLRDTVASIADQVAPTEQPLSGMVHRIVLDQFAEEHADPKYAARVAQAVAAKVADAVAGRA